MKLQANLNNNITFNINTGNPDKRILQNAKALIDSGCRVFWNYVHTNQLDSDIQKAKKISQQYNFYGFIYDNQISKEEIVIDKKEKPDMPEVVSHENAVEKIAKPIDVVVENTEEQSDHLVEETDENSILFPTRNNQGNAIWQDQMDQADVAKVIRHFV